MTLFSLQKANLRIEFSEKETSFRQRIAELERELETTRETGRHLRAYFAGPEFDARIRSDSRVLNESGNAFDIGFHDPESRSSLTGSSIEKFAPLPFQADDVESSHSQTDNHSSRSNTLPSTRELELASTLCQREALMNEYRQELDLLRTQLSALQHIVQVQEKQIRKASVPTASNFPSQSASSSTSTPALALLTRWREKVYSTLVQLKSEELQREELRREFSHQVISWLSLFFILFHVDAEIFICSFSLSLLLSLLSSFILSFFFLTTKYSLRCSTVLQKSR